MYRFAARTLTHTVLGFLLLASSAPLFGQGAKVNTPGKWAEERQERREDERSFPLARRLWFMKGRQAPKGETPAGARIKAFRQKQALRAANEERFRAMRRPVIGPHGMRSPIQVTDGPDRATRSGLLPNSTPAFTQAWTALGPTPIGSVPVTGTSF